MPRALQEITAVLFTSTQTSLGRGSTILSRSANENTVTSPRDYPPQPSYLPRLFWRRRCFRLGRFSPRICKYQNRKEICFGSTAPGPRNRMIEYVMLRLEGTDIRALKFENRHTPVYKTFYMAKGGENVCRGSRISKIGQINFAQQQRNRGLI